MGRGLKKPPPPHPRKPGREGVDGQSGWRPRVRGALLAVSCFLGCSSPVEPPACDPEGAGSASCGMPALL